jgi:flagellar basal body-associated protein FliL
LFRGRPRRARQPVAKGEKETKKTNQKKKKIIIIIIIMLFGRNIRFAFVLFGFFCGETFLLTVVRGKESRNLENEEGERKKFPFWSWPCPN